MTNTAVVLFSDPKTGSEEALGRLFNAKMKPEEAVPDQLRDRGLDPKSVKTVVMTHLHVDHASGVAQFPDATFVVTQREWESATGGPQLRRG